MLAEDVIVEAHRESS